MAYAVRIGGRAARQIEEASAWWWKNRPAAPGAIAEEIHRVLPLLSQQPSVGTGARNINLRGVRRIYLSRIRYYLYYRVRDSVKLVEVLAFWHSSRESGPQSDDEFDQLVQASLS